jgi:OmpA-OmpF porin, OOP family
MKLRTSLVALAALALPAMASAEPVSGIYVSVGGGGNWMSSPLEHKSIAQNFNAGPPGFALILPDSGNVSYYTGYAFVGSVGWGWGNGIRTELEVGYRNNGPNAFVPGPQTPIGLKFSGDERKLSFMGNLFYDFNDFAKTFNMPVTPYLGIGAGISSVDWSNVSRSGGGLNFGPPLGVATNIQSWFSSTDWVLAAQAMVGFSYDIPGIPGLSLTSDFRIEGLPQGFRQHGTLTLGFGNPGSPYPTMTSPTSHVYNEEFNYSMMLGLRYAFGAPKAAPAPAAPMGTPAPAVQPARSYLVFFDWDKATLTDRARQIIKEAADNSTRVQYTQIAVNGYADTSGTPQYNQGLSMRRAQAVAAELVKDGVNKGAIAIKAFGDTVLLVQTGAGVREPQNRRVEIIIK